MNLHTCLRLVAVVPVMLIPVTGTAHELWLEQVPGGMVLRYGHSHSSHDGEALISYGPDFVRAVDCVRDDGQVLGDVYSSASPLLIQRECAVLHVLTSSGFWTRTTQGLRNQPASQLSGVLRSWESMEGVKRIETWNESLTEPLSDALEICPRSDPFRLRPGDKIRLRVTLEGRPVQGATVAYDGEPRGVTDSDGTVNLRIRHGGPQSISASLERPRADGLADTTVHATALTFDLPE